MAYKAYAHRADTRNIEQDRDREDRDMTDVDRLVRERRELTAWLQVGGSPDQQALTYEEWLARQK
jgi:hypothetical protein